MEKSISLILAFSLLLGATLALPSFKPDVRIFNGESAKPGQFPFIVALQDSSGQFCSGSIINKNWIITAAYCVMLILNFSGKILAGTNLLNNGGTVYNVDIGLFRSDFEMLSLRNNIGLIKIDGDFQFNDLVQPIDIGYAEINDTVTAAGWGITENNLSEDLRYIQLRALSSEECREIAQNHMGHYYLGPEQFCALANETNKGVCTHDYGGPLISNGKLVGIISGMIVPCGKGVPDLYTRPSEYIDWINLFINE